MEPRRDRSTIMHNVTRRVVNITVNGNGSVILRAETHGRASLPVNVPIFFRSIFLGRRKNRAKPPPPPILSPALIGVAASRFRIDISHQTILHSTFSFRFVSLPYNSIRHANLFQQSNRSVLIILETSRIREQRLSSRREIGMETLERRRRKGREKKEDGGERRGEREREKKEQKGRNGANEPASSLIATYYSRSAVCSLETRVTRVRNRPFASRRSTTAPRQRRRRRQARHTGPNEKGLDTFAKRREFSGG